MFKKILIANRGEIACRVAATARRLGVHTVAVHSNADANAKHVQVCDEAVSVATGAGNSPKDSYLRWQAILDAAKATGAQAIHPGYGFLSENDDFAQACADAGVVFIGPPPSAIKAMGLKAQSKQLMQVAGVPLVPGYHGLDQDPALLQREADRIGYPVLIKASAGGGGKGMRAVDRAEDFAKALASCQREAINSFGDDAVLIEKYVQRPRHIEIQVFADSHGQCVYLFERDCSVQRRHQKVLEEAPAPGLSAALREQMGQAAVAAAQAVGYVGAGTVEFIVEQRANGSMNFFFMEMNTRLQVEHPVTEAITGYDLVEWQLRVASGERLPVAQADLRMHGHAIEARICAESPDQQFLPATGRLERLRWPEHVAFSRNADGEPMHDAAPVRVDAGVREGDAISPFYDSMVAKLIVWGSTREQALVRLDTALALTRIVGLQTNLQFLRHVAQTESFSMASLDTALIDREATAVFNQDRVGSVTAIAACVAHIVNHEQRRPAAGPFDRRDGFAAYTGMARRFLFSHLGIDHSAVLHYGKTLTLQVGDVSARLSFSTEGNDLLVCHGANRVRSEVLVSGEEHHVFTPVGATRLTCIDPLAHAAQAGVEGGRLTAPMPGKVISFLVAPGDVVSAGQALAVMEAMKMEHTIASPKSGTVTEILYAPGDQVSEGVELLKLAD